ncbi:uncharacterized protein LOC124131519 [Haliotis rufescens]|uniref:uncharacterized protein LOC124131519 n=1 Tax=Haliotis rufescens TaxID=6454 RepID=UPI001EB079F3|nr:uncharacterized protein LOC124131519 [Haliotis rufescens]XP_046350770.1 uncharacterized protein LOC124131519 [Haliotis rufescens]
MAAMDSSQDNIKVTNITSTLTLYESSIKPASQNNVIADTLVLFFGWLNAKPETLDKYRKLYLSRGFDVLFINGKLSHFAWPPGSVQASFELLQLLKKKFDRYDHYLAHGVSVGAYNYTICLQMATDMPVHCGHFSEKLKGVVLDSTTCGSLSRMAVGVSQGVTNSAFLRKIIQKSMEYYFAITRRHTADFYEKEVQFFIDCPAEVPTLILASRDDPMSDPQVVEDIHSRWEAIGSFKVFYKMWETSTHAAHYRSHPEEYLTHLGEFLAAYEQCAATGNKTKGPQSKL